jgi:hypothetical protein
LNAYAVATGELTVKLAHYFRHEEAEFSPDDIAKMQQIDAKSADFIEHYFPAQTESSSETDNKETAEGLVPNEAQFIENLRTAVLPTVEKINQIIELTDGNGFSLSSDQIIELRSFGKSFPASVIPKSIADMETAYDGDTTKLDIWLARFKELSAVVDKYLDQIPDLYRQVKELEAQKHELQNQEKELASRGRLKPERLTEKILAKLGKLPEDVTANQAQLYQIKDQIHSLSQDLWDVAPQLKSTVSSVNSELKKLLELVESFTSAFEWAKKHVKKRVIGEDAVDKLTLVRVTNQTPQEGALGPVIGKDLDSRKKLPSARLSVHYTLNGPVASHLGGVWGQESLAYIAPLGAFVETNGKPAHLNTSDTWFLGDSVFPEGTVLLVKKGTSIKLPAAQRQHFKIIETDNPNEAVDQTVADLGYEPPRSLDYLHLDSLGTTGSEETHYDSDFNRLENAWAYFVEGEMNNDEPGATMSAVRFLTKLASYPSWPEAERIPSQKVFELYQPFLNALRIFFKEGDRLKSIKQQLENHEQSNQKSFDQEGFETAVADFDKAIQFLESNFEKKSTKEAA